MLNEIKEIVEESLYKLEKYSPDALALVIRTGRAETNYKHLKQMGGGPALGFFQCEPNTAHDIVKNYIEYRPHYRLKLEELGCDFENLEFSLMSNIAVQAAFCRIVYLRDPHPIPSLNDLEEQARCWKRVYNTKLGKGTIEHFMEANEDGFC